MITLFLNAFYDRILRSIYFYFSISLTPQAWDPAPATTFRTCAGPDAVFSSGIVSFNILLPSRAVTALAFCHPGAMAVFATYKWFFIPFFMLDTKNQAIPGNILPICRRKIQIGRRIHHLRSRYIFLHPGFHFAGAVAVGFAEKRKQCICRFNFKLPVSEKEYFIPICFFLLYFNLRCFFYKFENPLDEFRIL